MKRRITLVAITALLMLFISCNPDPPIQYHKVNYIGTDGNIMVTHEVENGKTDTPHESPMQQGYKFIGWSLSKDGNGTFDFNTPITSDITLYPVWSINSYKVTFVYGEDVTFSSSEISVDYGNPIPTQDVTRTGYSLKGWSTKEDGSEPYDLSSPVTSDITLYPVWSINSYKVTFVCGEDVVNPPSEISVDYDNPIPPQDVTRVGYSLKGWSTKADGSEPYDLSSPVTSDITLYPVWSINSYKVTFVCGEDVVNPPSEILVDYGNTIPPQNVTRVGYSLKGWSMKEDGSESYDLNTPVIGNITLYPVWSINSYKVTFVCGEDVVNPPSEISVDCDNPIPPQDVTRVGYSLKGWSTKEDGSEPYDLSFPVTSDITLYPVWSINSYKVTFVCGEDVVNPPSEISVDYGNTISPQDVTRVGYSLKGWSTKEDGSEPYDLNTPVIGDITLYPVFEAKEMIVNFIYEDEEPLASKTYRTGDLLTPSSLGIGLDDSIFTWELADSSTEEQYPVDKSLPYSESGYTFVVHISSSYMSVEESGAISGSEVLKAKEGPYTLFIPRYLNEKRVTSIKEKAFYTDGVENSQTYTFDKLILPDTLTSIGNSAFTSCKKLIELDIPSSVKSIGVYAFGDCSLLRKVLLHEGIEDIGIGSFCDCVNLIEIYLPSSIKTIDTDVFSRCYSLESITLPANITSIPERCFTGCSSLINIYFEGTITKIEEEAFSNCDSLASFSIPDTVTSIGVHVFSGCSKLSDIKLPSGITSLNSGIFIGCSSLTSIVIPETVTSIGNSAFNHCSGLTSINIPSSVVSIGKSAFMNSGLESIVIPENVNSIGEGAFQLCSNLSTITFNGQKITSIAANTFKECENLASITLPDSVTSIGTYAFSNCSNLTSVTLNNTLAKISDYAFFQCSNLKNVVIPGSVQTLGEYAFSECIKLDSITLNEGLLTIEDRCFEGCSSLKTITIPSSVNIMNGLPFRWCKNLTEIKISKYYDKIYGAPWGGTIYSPTKSITIKWLDHTATYDEE